MRTILIFLTVITAAQCRDFYIGMFKRGDFLAAQDNVYKERRPYGRVEADYGRLFKCKITYFRVVDRLGKGPGPVVRVLKGGLQKNYIAIRLRSGYNLPISVNIYVGCPNINLKDRILPIRPTKPTKPMKPTSATEAAISGSENSTEASQADTKTGATGTEGNEATTVAGGAATNVEGATTAGSEDAAVPTTEAQAE